MAPGEKIAERVYRSFGENYLGHQQALAHLIDTTIASARAEAVKSPYAGLTWEDIAMLKQENTVLKDAVKELVEALREAKYKISLARHLGDASGALMEANNIINKAIAAHGNGE
jgi:hypothetical protein